MPARLHEVIVASAAKSPEALVVKTASGSLTHGELASESAKSRSCAFGREDG